MPRPEQALPPIERVLQRIKIDAVCPQCGDYFATPQALGSHARRHK
jgi:uncharacterized OB-fold protein